MILFLFADVEALLVQFWHVHWKLWKHDCSPPLWLSIYLKFISTLWMVLLSIESLEFLLDPSIVWSECACYWGFDSFWGQRRREVCWKIHMKDSDSYICSQSTVRWLSIFCPLIVIKFHIPLFQMSFILEFVPWIRQSIYTLYNSQLQTTSPELTGSTVTLKCQTPFSSWKSIGLSLFKLVCVQIIDVAERGGKKPHEN